MADAGIAQRTIAAAGTAGRAFNALSFHSLRHTFVTQLEATGVAPDQRMLLADHTDAKSHARLLRPPVGLQPQIMQLLRAPSRMLAALFQNQPFLLPMFLCRRLFCVPFIVSRSRKLFLRLPNPVPLGPKAPKCDRCCGIPPFTL